MDLQLASLLKNVFVNNNNDFITTSATFHYVFINFFVCENLLLFSVEGPYFGKLQFSINSFLLLLLRSPLPFNLTYVLMRGKIGK